VYVIRLPLIRATLFRLGALITRWPKLMALVGFISGAASYLLVENREAFAQVIAVLMLVSWLWLVLENWLRAGILRRFGFDIPPTAMRFATQMVHQESLFFALPFFLAVTNWSHGQALFTAVLMLCALISIIDPIYYNHLAPRRPLFVSFHAFALFAVLLIVLPLILYLTTEQTLALALGMALLLSLPSLSLLSHGNWRRLPMLLLVLLVLGVGIWSVRSWIPPAALQMISIVLTLEIDQEKMVPGEALTQFDMTTLNQNGLYVWTAVRAPRGLKEQIHHVWTHEGTVVDRIHLDIQGGREAGYRAWSHKLNFGAGSAGRWQVRVITDSGQLIGLARFTVTDNQLADPVNAGL